MIRFFFLLAILSTILTSCSDGASITELHETLSVNEIADKANSDPAVLTLFKLESQVQQGRTDAQIGGATLPEFPESEILASSTSEETLSNFLRSYDFNNANELGKLYAERNVLMVKVAEVYKPLLNKLSDTEKEELNALLPEVMVNNSTEHALEQLKSR